MFPLTVLVVLSGTFFEAYLVSMSRFWTTPPLLPAAVEGNMVQLLRASGRARFFEIVPPLLVAVGRCYCLNTAEVAEVDVVVFASLFTWFSFPKVVLVVPVLRGVRAVDCIISVYVINKTNLNLIN